MAELDELIKLFLIAFRDRFDFSIREVSHPTRKSKSPSLFGYLSPEENPLHYPTDQYPCTSRQPVARLANQVPAHVAQGPITGTLASRPWVPQRAAEQQVVVWAASRLQLFQ
jgi:hypothetical protein